MHRIFLLLLFTITTLLSSQIGIVQGLDPNGDGFLSLRKQPKSTEIGKLHNGDAVEILDRSGKYYKVKDIKSRKVGWAHSNWIKIKITSSIKAMSKKGTVQGLDRNGNEELTVNNVLSQIASDTTQCTYFIVEVEQQLNIRDKAGMPSNIVGRANLGERVCVYDFKGKWGRTDLGWISVKYLKKDIEKNNFLLADIDHDGKKERLQWEYLDVDGFSLLLLKLLDDDGSLLWEGPRNDESDEMDLINIEEYTPEILDDIDEDGNIELVIGSSPHESVSPGYNVYIWDGKKFIKATKSKFYRDLVWVDAPNGKTLKWTVIDGNDYSKKKKIWWTYGLHQMNNNNKLYLVNILGMQYTDDAFLGSKAFSYSKAIIRFTPTGAVIKELIKDIY